MRFADHADLRLGDHWPEVPWVADAGHFDKGASMDRKDGAGSDSDKNIAGQIVHKERTVPRIDVRIIVGHHRQQADWVVAFGLLGGHAMDASCSSQSRQCTRPLDGRY